jgi:hypothetical protein
MAQAARAIEARRTPFDPYKNIPALQAIQKYRNAGFWLLPPACRTYSESVMAQAEGDMEAALAAFPRLTTYGFVADPATDDGNMMGRRLGRRTPEMFAEDRADMTAPDHLTSLVACQAWLRINACPCVSHVCVHAHAEICPPGRPRMNDRLSSHILAHIVASEIGFIKNGVLIAAMAIEGYAVETVVCEDLGWETGAARFNVELSPDACERHARRCEQARLNEERRRRGGRHERRRETHYAQHRAKG